MRLISSELKYLVDNNRVSPKEYLKKRAAQLVVLGVVIGLLFTSLFTDFGFDIGQFLINFVLGGG